MAQYGKQQIRLTNYNYSPIEYLTNGRLNPLNQNLIQIRANRVIKILLTFSPDLFDRYFL